MAVKVKEADGEERAVAYAECRARVRALLQGVDDVQTETVVPACPEWSVRNLTAHLAGVARDLVEGRPPSGDPQVWVDQQVRDRSDRSVRELLDEWDGVGPAFEDLLRARPRAFGGLLYDVVVHEHDAASALGMKSDRSSTGVKLCLDIVALTIAKDLAAHDLAAVRFTDGTTTWEVGDGEVEFSVESDAFSLMRFLGSRRSLDQMRACNFTGDLDRFLPALSHLPLPKQNLIE